jgi:hypothetical protein
LGIPDEDLPKCEVDPDSIILEANCSTVATPTGETVGPCNFIVRFKPSKDPDTSADYYDIDVTAYDENGKVVMHTNQGTNGGVNTGTEGVDSNGNVFKFFDIEELIKEQYNARFDLDKYGPYTLRDIQTLNDIYTGHDSNGNGTLPAGSKFFSCGKQKFVIKIKPHCKCPKVPAVECGTPGRCDLHLDSGDMAKDVQGKDRKFILYPDGKTFIETKPGDANYKNGVSLPADKEYRDAYLKGHAKDPSYGFTNVLQDLSKKFCINGVMTKGPNDGDICTGGKCTWECTDLTGKIVKKCSLEHKVSCATPPAGTILTPPKTLTYPSSEYTKEYTKWLKDHLDYSKDGFRGGWYGLCMVDGKKTNQCSSNPQSTGTSGKQWWTCGEDPNKQDCYSCDKAACGSAAGGRYSMKELQEIWKKNRKSDLLCNPGTSSTPGGNKNDPHKVIWGCIASKDCGGNGIECSATEKYCGDKITDYDIGEQCETDAECGAGGACNDCVCCPTPRCGQPTGKPKYGEDSDGTYKMFYTPTPQCIDGVVKDESKTTKAPAKWWSYTDANGNTKQYSLYWASENESLWDRPYFAGWTCQSKCSKVEIACSVASQRCGDGVLDSGEECEKDIACADGSTCGQDKKCQCGPQDECQKDSDCPGTVKSCNGRSELVTDSYICTEDVNKVKRCEKSRSTERKQDESYCDKATGAAVISRDYYCVDRGLGPFWDNDETKENCDDGVDCNGIEMCSETSILGIRTAECNRVVDVPSCSSSNLFIDTCNYKPDDNPLTRDSLSFLSQCHELNAKSSVYGVGWSCTKAPLPDHACDKACGAKCLAQNNDDSGRNADCVVSLDKRCSGKKALIGDPYGTCTTGCSCSFPKLEYKCVAGNCGAECSDGDVGCQPDCTLFKCGDGIVQGAEECDPPAPAYNSPLIPQQISKCENKVYLWEREDGFGNCTVDCKIQLDPYVNKGCSDKQGCTGATVCNGKKNGERASDDSGYCQECAVVACLPANNDSSTGINKDCTNMHYACFGTDLYSQHETCDAKGQCVLDKDKAHIAKPEHCGEVTDANYSCDSTRTIEKHADRLLFTPGACEASDEYKDGTGTFKNGKCVKGPAKVTLCGDRLECLTDQKTKGGNIIYNSRGACDIPNRQCTLMVATAIPNGNCTYTRTDCTTDLSAVKTLTGKCTESTIVDNLDKGGNGCDEIPTLKQCKTTPYTECDGDWVKTKAEKCGDDPNKLGEKACNAAETTPGINCANLNSIACDKNNDTVWIDQKLTCGTDPGKTTPKCVIESEDIHSCSNNNYSAVSVCGDNTAALLGAKPSIKGPYTNIYAYRRGLYTSQCTDTVLNPPDGDKKPECSVCDPSIPGSKCAVTTLCSNAAPDCKSDISCNGKAINADCSILGKAGKCDGTCTCVVPECGSDDSGKGFVGGGEPALANRCASGSTAKNYVFDTTNNQWTWDCCIGSACVAGGCNAVNVACGDLSGGSYLKGVNNWLKDKVTNVSYNPVTNLNRYCVNSDRVSIVFNYTNNGTPEWTWTCEKDNLNPDGSTTTVKANNCNARLSGCGYADAQHWLDGGQSLSFANGRGAYNNSILSVNNNILCGSGTNSVTGLTTANAAYGKWTWQCDGQPACSARRQCENVNIETVYYAATGGTGQCWTADEEADTKGDTLIEWPDAMFCSKRSSASGSCGARGVFHNYYQDALLIKYDNGWGLNAGGGVYTGGVSDLCAKDIQGSGTAFTNIINASGHAGICPSGFVIPTTVEWNKLSNAVYSLGSRTLRDRSAFDAIGSATVGYWTASPNSRDDDGDGVYNYSPFYFDDPSGAYVSQSATGYIVNQGGETVYSSNAAGSKHQLRCIQVGSFGGIINRGDGGSGSKPCRGRGCWLRL